MTTPGFCPVDKTPFPLTACTRCGTDMGRHCLSRRYGWCRKCRASANDRETDPFTPFTPSDPTDSAKYYENLAKHHRNLAKYYESLANH